MLEIVVHRSKEQVNQAIVQFAARRSYRLTNPWWIEGIRIESPQASSGYGFPLKTYGNLVASFFDLPQFPRIEIEIKRKRGETRLKVKVSSHPASIQLAYELQSYLLNDRAYDTECPPMCTQCGHPVRNVTAKYCGRCGRKLVLTETDDPRPHETAVAIPPLPVRSSIAERLPPPVVIERSADRIETAEPDGIETRDDIETAVAGVASAVAADQQAEQPDESRPEIADGEVAVISAVSEATEDIDPAPETSHEQPADTEPALAAEDDSTVELEEAVEPSDNPPEAQEAMPPRRALAEE